MTTNRPLTALGMMSGTSLDGIDAAVIVSDGERILEAGASKSIPYDPAFRERLRRCLGKKSDQPGVEEVAQELTLFHVRLVEQLLAANGLEPSDVDLIGFHGHTILHRPEDRMTVQIGDPAVLARETGIDVVGDMRQNDVAKGGEGAPLAPLYHFAITVDQPKPLAVLNIGGVANVTWIGDGGSVDDPNILAFDTGPGNALIDDWVSEKIGRPMDEGGRLAHDGRIDERRLADLLDNPFFNRQAPKSLDRDDFSVSREIIDGLSSEDGAATLCAFTAHSIAQSMAHLPSPPLRWLVTGGGRHNRTLMSLLKEVLGVSVEAIEAIGEEGDTLEARAFGYLAVRSVLGLPITFPGTTKAHRPLTGGVLYKA